MERISIHTDTIRLDQLLKLAGVVPTGGAVHQLLEEGRIFVDGVRETARRKQLVPGMVVKLVLEEGESEYQVVREA